MLVNQLCKSIGRYPKAFRYILLMQAQTPIGGANQTAFAELADASIVPSSTRMMELRFIKIAQHMPHAGFAAESLGSDDDDILTLLLFLVNLIFDMLTKEL